MKKIYNNKDVSLRIINNDYYFEKNNIIVDRICPKCSKYLFDNRSFCVCGYNLKKKENRFILKLLLLGIFCGLFITYFLFTGIKIFYSETNKILNASDIEKLSPINIQMLSALKDNYYYNYIQDFYIKNKDKSKLYILIKPSLWKILSKQDKIILLNQVNKEWQRVFKRNFSESKEIPTVVFANY